MAKISVITINYNNLDGLIKTVESVVNQNFKDFEYLVIDGNSTDGANEYLEKKSNYFDYWVSEPDKGIYNAMNKGIDKATGDYLLFLNSGDVFYSENSLQTFLPYIATDHPKDIIYGDICFVSDKEHVICPPNEIDFTYFLTNSLPHPCTLIKRKLFENEKYDENLKIVSDWKFFLNVVCKHKATYQKIDGIISLFDRTGISSVPENKKQIFKENELVFNQEYGLDFKKICDYKTNKDKVNYYESEYFISKYLKLKVWGSLMKNKFFR